MRLSAIFVFIAAWTADESPSSSSREARLIETRERHFEALLNVHWTVSSMKRLHYACDSVSLCHLEQGGAVFQPYQFRYQAD